MIDVADFRGGLLVVLDELFETNHGYVLDPNETIFETLASIDAHTASTAPAPGMATLAAQVTHLEFLIDGLVNHFGESLDWGAAWQVSTITADDWAALVSNLHLRYDEVKAFVQANDNWDANMIGGAFALVAHIAYHHGQIREALGTVQSAD
jgi:hypothetical protein